ncbi:N-acetyltransferase ECO1 [[Candida] zeylanoides]
MPKRQSTFGAASTTCRVCGMMHSPSVARDRDAHRRYHERFTKGVAWPQRRAPLWVATVRRRHPPAALEVAFYSVEKQSAPQVARARQLLAMVNTELRAPAESQAWRRAPAGGDRVEARAFVAVHDGRAIGVVATDPIESAAEQARWMVCRTQQVVAQACATVRVGVSRIWVAPAFRRLGIATLLLRCVTHHSVYGIVLEAREVAFSQPSSAGGHLARHFNGVTHKSGETLVPVYIERDRP